MKVSFNTIQTITLFVVAFIVIGYTAPIASVAVAPDERFVEIHNFEATNTHVGADAHNICFNRTANPPTDVDITVEVILMQDNMSIEKTSYEIDAYHQKSSEPIIFERKLPENLEPGTYQYEHNVEATYFANDVEKNIQFRSEEFTVYENKSDLYLGHSVITC